jgi:uncharacterized OB-fold protein
MKHLTDIGTEQIAPMLPGIFTLPPYGEKLPMLLGGYCVHCEASFFPKPRYCPRCLETPVSREIGNTGAIHSFTVVRIKPPLGLPQPYSVGYVDLDGDMTGSGLRVFCLFDPDSLDQLKIGMKVTLQVGPLGHDGREDMRLRPFFKPVNMKQER